MNNKFFKKIKERLEKTKALLESRLSKFAKKDTHIKGDWDTKFPDIGIETSDDALEDTAKKREEYERLLPVEWTFEKKLRKINLALKKLKKKKYGLCEKCGAKIVKGRLSAIPEARFCQKCRETEETK